MNVITGIGLVSALGLDSSTSLAAARAGLSRCAKLRTVNPAGEDFLDGSPVTGHALPCGIGEGFVGAAKALLMGRAAIDDLLSRHDVSTLGRIGIYVVLSNYFLNDGADTDLKARRAGDELPSAKWRRATNQFVPRLTSTNALSSALLQRLYYGGHAGIAQALVDAEHDLDGGAVDACVVGAIDSCVEPLFLRASAKANLLKTEAVATGLIPGEAAAFVVLESPKTSTQRKAPVGLAALATANDQHHMLSEHPPTGAALASAIEHCLEQLHPEEKESVRLLVSDCNGDERRALEWGYCLVRLRSRYAVGTARTWLPAMSFGETGCASGPVAICMAVRALQRGYAGTPLVAIVLSSDDGLKASLCLSLQPGR